MRKRIFAAVLLTAVTAMSSCGKTSGAEVRLGSSEIYTESERQQAADEAMRYFRKNFDGCELIEIHYAGDEISLKETEWYRPEDGKGSDYMVFLSDFYVKPNGGDGSLSQDSVYSDWQWLMVRDSSGKWVHLDHGYG